MCVEIEAKLKVDSPEDIEDRLRESGAEFTAEQSQVDIHFDDTNSSLVRNDKCLRLRRQEVNGTKEYFLTFKGPEKTSSFKMRQEIEVEIKDSDSIRKLLSALGYKSVLSVEKTRKLWRLGGCEVALDHLELLGDFVEIEGPDEEKIAAVQKQLGLAGLRHIKQSYAYMIQSKLSEIGREQIKS